MRQFKVVLDRVRLDDDQADRLNGAIQQAVLDVLAEVDTGGDQASVILRKLGPATRGIIAVSLDVANPNFDRLQELNARFEERS